MTSTSCELALTVLISSSREPSTTLIASIALIIKLRTTCCSWTRVSVQTRLSDALPLVQGDQ